MDEENKKVHISEAQRPTNFALDDILAEFGGAPEAGSEEARLETLGDRSKKLVMEQLPDGAGALGFSSLDDVISDAVAGEQSPQADRNGREAEAPSETTDPNAAALAAAGLEVSQPRPAPFGAPEDVIARVEGGIYAAPSVTTLLRDDPDPANLLRTVLSDFDVDILTVDPIEYRCYCSHERTQRALLSLGSQELEDILREQGGAELTCQFCDRVHRFDAQELRGMIEALKAQGK